MGKKSYYQCPTHLINQERTTLCVIYHCKLKRLRLTLVLAAVSRLFPSSLDFPLDDTFLAAVNTLHGKKESLHVWFLEDSDSFLANQTRLSFKTYACDKIIKCPHLVSMRHSESTFPFFCFLRNSYGASERERELSAPRVK